MDEEKVQNGECMNIATLMKWWDEVVELYSKDIDWSPNAKKLIEDFKNNKDIKQLYVEEYLKGSSPQEAFNILL